MKIDSLEQHATSPSELVDQPTYDLYDSALRVVMLAGSHGNIPDNPAVAPVAEENQKLTAEAEGLDIVLGDERYGTLQADFATENTKPGGQVLLGQLYFGNLIVGRRFDFWRDGSVGTSYIPRDGPQKVDRIGPDKAPILESALKSLEQQLVGRQIAALAVAPPRLH